MFRQLFSRLLTGSPQAPGRDRLETLERLCRDLRHDFTLMSREVEDHVEKTRRGLERYRARDQARKSGKFGTEDAPGDDNSHASTVAPTHSEIERLARDKGLCL